MSDVSKPTDEQLAGMSREELVELGGRLDGVETVFKEDRWPVEGTRAEKRAERGVALWLLVGGLSGLRCCWCSCSGRGSTNRTASGQLPPPWPPRCTA